MKFLILLILIPVLVFGALRLNLTPFRLLSSSEYAEMQKKSTEQEAQIKALQTQVEQMRQAPKISDGSWMRDSGKGSALTPPKR